MIVSPMPTGIILMETRMNYKNLSDDYLVPDKKINLKFLQQIEKKKNEHHVANIDLL